MKIAFPKDAKTAAARMARSAVAQTAASGTIQSLAEFTCFGVVVSGPGIAPDSRLGCAGPADPNGIFGGLASTDGGEIEVSVPVGPSRNIQVFGVQSSVGCAALNEILSRPAADRFKGMGAPYVLGTATTEVMQDTTVNLKVAFDPSNAKKLYDGCGGSSAESRDPASEPAGNRFSVTSGGGHELKGGGVRARISVTPVGKVLKGGGISARLGVVGIGR